MTVKELLSFPDCAPPAGYDKYLFSAIDNLGKEQICCRGGLRGGHIHNLQRIFPSFLEWEVHKAYLTTKEAKDFQDPPQKSHPKSFLITWKDSRYTVNVPDYGGGRVVGWEDYVEALASISCLLETIKDIDPDVYATSHVVRKAQALL